MKSYRVEDAIKDLDKILSKKLDKEYYKNSGTLILDVGLVIMLAKNDIKELLKNSKGTK